MANGHVKPPAEWQEAVQRVLASELFQKSPKLRDLFHHIATHSLKGDRELLSEQQIGIAVFGRSPGYNAGADSIVRVQARNLRDKLAEYYEREGAGDPIVVSIPKGGYDLNFAPRVSGPMPGHPAPGRRNQILAGCLVAAAAFGLGFAARGYRAARGQEAANAAGLVPQDQLAPNSVLRSVFSPAAQTLVVFEDALLVMASLARGRVFSLEEFAGAGSAAPDLGGVNEETAGRRLRQMLPNSRMVQLANVTFAVRLLRPYAHLSQSAVFKHAREAQLREIKSSNCVLFGAQLSNPWIELYEPELNFRFRLLSEGSAFENRQPKPGEARAYGGKMAADGVTYARIALLPNLQPDTRVLILTGLGSAATEAAAEFILNPNLPDLAPPELRERLRGTPKHVEILLSTNRVGRTAGSVRVEAWRAE